MSHYLDMLKKSSGGTSAFLLLVNPLGDCVVHKLDGAGNSVGFAAGRPEEVLGEPLTAASPHCHVVKIAYPDSPWRWGLDGQCWGQIAEAMTVGKTIASRKNRAVWALLAELCLPIDDWIVHGIADGRHVYRATEAALAADVRRFGVPAASGAE